MSTTDCERPRKKVERPRTYQQEVEAKKQYEEFWSDPCWTEPLDSFE